MTDDAPPPLRTFVDPETHVTWVVSEAPPSGLPVRLGQRSLIFASTVTVRRVWSYPANWRDLSAAELVALSWRV